MEKAEPASPQTSTPSGHYPPLPVDEQPLQRAQKRLVTQSEREAMAELPPQAATGPQLETERAVEGQ